MNDQGLWSVFVTACLTNNFVLAYFLGICPFLGVSGKVQTSARMGAAVVFVMLTASACAYGINTLLTAIAAEYLRLISFIAVIASTVQLVEMFIKKMSPGLFRAMGVFLPLITTQGSNAGGSTRTPKNAPAPKSSRSAPRQKSAKVKPRPMPNPFAIETPIGFFDANASARPRMMQFTTISEMNAPSARCKSRLIAWMT